MDPDRPPRCRPLPAHVVESMAASEPFASHPEVLDRLDAALAAPDDGGDPCLVTGAGWIAEEALATALLCAVRHAGDPVTALARAATTSGDSDSIACLTGAVLGASHGMTAWPPEWAGRIEYADQLDALGRSWNRRATAV